MLIMIYRKNTCDYIGWCMTYVVSPHITLGVRHIELSKQLII